MRVTPRRSVVLPAVVWPAAARLTVVWLAVVWLAVVWLSVPPAAAEQKSLSLGTPTHGHLEHASRLPLRGRGYQVIQLTRDRGFVYGTTELVGLVKRLGIRMARKFPNSTLYVGNISRKRGGDIPQSVTHNSGRDVDILFYARDKRGKAAPRSQFLRFDKKGKAGELTFDVPRNWELVKAAILDKDSQVQSILVAHWLKRKLLRYAKQRKERRSLIKRAEKILRHPWGAAPHDDHFHLRIYCSLHERLEGCINRGPEHPWADLYDKEVAELVRKLQRKAVSSDAAVARSAIDHLGRLAAASAAPTLEKALGDGRDAVRRAALKALGKVGGLRGALSTILSEAKKASRGEWRATLMGVLAERPVRKASALFARLLQDHEALNETRAAGAKGLGELRQASAVPHLAEALSDRSGEVRKAAQESLLAITGRDRGVGPDATKVWKAWWQTRQRKGRIAWLAEAFEADHGFALTRKSCRRALRYLLRGVRRGGVAGEHARLLFKALVKFQPKRIGSARQAHRTYKRWAKRYGARRCRRAPKRL